MRLRYECIVNDNRIFISVDESDDPWVTLNIQGHDDIRFKASVNADCKRPKSASMTQS